MKFWSQLRTGERAAIIAVVGAIIVALIGLYKPNGQKPQEDQAYFFTLQVSGDETIEVKSFDMKVSLTRHANCNSNKTLVENLRVVVKGVSKRDIQLVVEPLNQPTPLSFGRAGNFTFTPVHVEFGDAKKFGSSGPVIDKLLLSIRKE